MTDRHCRIGRIATKHPLPRIPGYTLIYVADTIEDYDEPPCDRKPAPIWWVYRHHDTNVGRYGS